MYTAISGKVVLQRRNAYATISKVTMGNGGFTVACLKLKVFHRDGRKQHKHVHLCFLLPSC